MNKGLERSELGDFGVNWTPKVEDMAVVTWARLLELDFRVILLIVSRACESQRMGIVSLQPAQGTLMLVKEPSFSSECRGPADSRHVAPVSSGKRSQ